MLKNPELSVQARSLMMEIWKCDRFVEYRKVSVYVSNNIVSIQDMLAGLIINWKREDIYKSDEEKEVEKKEILDVILFAKDCFPEKFEFFKKLIIRNLRLAGRPGKKVNVDYGLFAEELFSELERTTLPTGPGGDGPWNNLRSQFKASLPLDDGPQSELGTPSVSGVSSYKKESVFTLSGNK